MAVVEMPDQVGERIVVGAVVEMPDQVGERIVVEAVGKLTDLADHKTVVAGLVLVVVVAAAAAEWIGQVPDKSAGVADRTVEENFVVERHMIAGAAHNFVGVGYRTVGEPELVAHRDLTDYCQYTLRIVTEVVQKTEHEY